MRVYLYDTDFGTFFDYCYCLVFNTLVLTSLLLLSHQQRSSVASGGSGSIGAYADGVRMEEIVEGTVGALHILARESHNRAIIRGLNVIPIFVQVRHLAHDLL